MKRKVFMQGKHVEITDSPFFAADFAKQNIPYIVVLNENNRMETFPDGAYCVECEQDIDEEYAERVWRRFKGLPWEIVRTQRLIIREITPDDVPRLYELYDDESVTRYMEGLFPEPEKEMEYTKAYIEKVYRFYGYGMWVIVLKDSNEVIGRVGLEYKEGFEGLEIGFMLGVEYQHQGYAYEACNAVLKYGIEQLGEQNFCAFTDRANTASVRLCRRLGFVRHGSVKHQSVDSAGKIAEKELEQYIYDSSVKRS